MWAFIDIQKHDMFIYSMGIHPLVYTGIFKIIIIISECFGLQYTESSAWKLAQI